jgi:hypothetical protein
MNKEVEMVPTSVKESAKQDATGQQNDTWKWVSDLVTLE